MDCKASRGGRQARPVRHSSGCGLRISFGPAVMVGMSEQVFHEMRGRSRGHDDHRTDGDELHGHCQLFVTAVPGHLLGFGAKIAKIVNWRPSHDVSPFLRTASFAPAPPRCPSPRGSSAALPGKVPRRRCACSCRSCSAGDAPRCDPWDSSESLPPSSAR